MEKYISFWYAGICLVLFCMSKDLYAQESATKKGSDQHYQINSYALKETEIEETHLEKGGEKYQIIIASLFDSTSYIQLSPGTFIRSQDGDIPAHNVSIMKDIQIGINEVTQAQWEVIMGYNPSDVINPYNPVESISWFEVNAFIDSLNVISRDSFVYRLPTEAEWEYACHAGASGASTLHEVAWFSENAEERPHPVRQKKANKWGLYDMQGNVWEWVQDWYGLYDPENNIDPIPPSSGRARIIRGGSWWSPAEITTCSHRGNLAPDYKAIILGFRLVRERPVVVEEGNK